jgi:hypothetical protein
MSVAGALGGHQILAEPHGHADLADGVFATGDRL